MISFEKKPVVLSDDIVFVLKPYQTEILYECCDCGLKHRILVSPREYDVKFRFIRQDAGFDLSKYDVETHTEKTA